jgi:hypothetical protein
MSPFRGALEDEAGLGEGQHLAAGELEVERALDDEAILEGGHELVADPEDERVVRRAVDDEGRETADLRRTVGGQGQGLAEAGRGLAGSDRVVLGGRTPAFVRRRARRRAGAEVAVHRDAVAVDVGLAEVAVEVEPEVLDAHTRHRAGIVEADRPMEVGDVAGLVEGQGLLAVGRRGVLGGRVAGGDGGGEQGGGHAGRLHGSLSFGVSCRFVVTIWGDCERRADRGVVCKYLKSLVQCALQYRVDIVVRIVSGWCFGCICPASPSIVPLPKSLGLCNERFPRPRQRHEQCVYLSTTCTENSVRPW